MALATEKGGARIGPQQTMPEVSLPLNMMQTQGASCVPASTPGVC